jgi:hypothetical protein
MNFTCANGYFDPNWLERTRGKGRSDIYKTYIHQERKTGMLGVMY